MTTYECDNLYFEETEYPEIPYKINNSTVKSYEPISTCVNKCSDKGGRSPPLLYNVAYLKEQL